MQGHKILQLLPSNILGVTLPLTFKWPFCFTSFDTICLAFNSKRAEKHPSVAAISYTFQILSSLFGSFHASLSLGHRSQAEKLFDRYSFSKLTATEREQKNRGRERVIRLLSKRTQVIHCSTETAECSHNTVARLGSKIGKYQVFSLYQFLWYNVSGHSQTRVSMQGNNGKKPQQVQFPLTTPRQAPLFKRLVSTVFHRLNIFPLLTFLMQNTVPYLKHSSSPPGLSPGDNDNTYGQQLIIKSGTYWTGLPD